MSPAGTHVGTVVGNTSPHEFRFFLGGFRAKLGDLVAVEMDVPEGDGDKLMAITVWARIVELGRYNPFLPLEAGQELAEEGLKLTDTVLSISRDQIDGKALVLGCTDSRDPTALRPLSYPVKPGAEIKLPPAGTVKSILVGDESVPRLRIGKLLGRSDIDVQLKTNVVVARHMAILAMTGGGKTVAARRVIRELLNDRYPMVILDPHGDYLGFWLKKDTLPGIDVKLYYPSLSVNKENRDLIGYLVTEMTSGFTDAQREKYHEALEGIDDSPRSVTAFIEKLNQDLGHVTASHKGTIPAIRRQLTLVKNQFKAMEKSNSRLRDLDSMKAFPFEPMPDPMLDPGGFVRPGRLSIVYLGGYDHLTQSTIVSVILKQLFEHRAEMSNKIPPFLTVIEEAHNFIPSRGEGQADTPSVATIRKVITEGRKFGAGLLLISQRPSRLDETALSQCNTFLIFRLVNPRDQRFVETVMENLTKEDSRLLPGFGPGQGIVSGQAVRFPLAIRVDNDEELAAPAIGSENFLADVASWEEGPEMEAETLTDDLLTELSTLETGASTGDD
jgi:DNA helicase HerA-like ATPase